MAAAVASGRQLSSSHKKRSFMNLRRDKSSESNLDRPGSSSASRNSSYFDIYPSRGESSPEQRLSHSRAEGDNIVPFPSVIDRNEGAQKTPHIPRRPSTAPSPDTQLPPLRFSGSSTISHSPPHTPTSSTPSDDLNLSAVMPVRLMAAPVVETTAMDAFVDGMNGGEEDMFASVEALRSPRRRRKSSTTNKGFHHPLYHPPLPTPPPGIKLGVATPDSDAEDDSCEDLTARLPRPRPRPAPRGSSTSTITQSKVAKRKESLPKIPSLVLTPSRGSSLPVAKPSPSPSSTDTPLASSIDEAVRRYVTLQETPQRPTVPSIHEIIQAHAPAYMNNNGHRTRLSVSSPGAPSPVPERPERRSLEGTSDAVSRSSMDSVAEEIQQTLRVALHHPATALQQTRSFSSPPEERECMSESGHGSPSISSFGTTVTAPSSPFGNSTVKNDSNHALATFLRSPRLTRLLKLRRHPNQRLQVSFSDLGSSTGKPVVVFLGLGAVRYIMGLYDEMAEALGLRLITIDRWGLGKTDSPSRGVSTGVREWASVVEEVLDYLNIDRFSLLAHSAGAPYAMALANRTPHRVQGSLCLLAPWVGAGEGTSGYKWLKYVPTGLIKTAQAAEWKVQAWMLGKPPSFNTGIGYTPRKDEAARISSFAEPRKSRETGRPSLGSFSDYDDLADFRGQYSSRSTIQVESPPHSSRATTASPPSTRKRTGSKSSRFFGGLWKNGESSKSPPPTKPPKLKSLKSMTSLRGKEGKTSTLPKSSRSQTGSLPDEIEDDWSTLSLSPSSFACGPLPEGARGHSRARRSISLSSRPSVKSQFSRTPSQRTMDRRMSSPPPSLGSAFESSPGPSNAALGNALLAASHNEAQRGTHADLLVILNHNQKPWGFSYEEFPLNVKVWYGEKDEKIAEGAVRWLERTMPPGTCELSVIKGAGHGLLYNGSVVVEAFEYLKDSWMSTT